MLTVGSLVARRYRIVRLIGQGGMGAVYEAVHEPLARRVALKTLLPDLAGGEALARFHREAATAASLRHPNIVEVTDFHHEIGECPVIVMELLEGESLRDVLERDCRLEPARAVAIARQVLAALAAAHAVEIVHRDVKPGNIHLRRTAGVPDLVKLVDFGLARISVGAWRTMGPSVTKTGQVLGTFAYMAPEQAAGLPVDARADVFSVGATLFHMLSGLRPIDAAAGTGGAPALARVAPWVDARLAGVVARAMRDRPEERFRTAEQMDAALAPLTAIALAATALAPRAASGGSATATLPPKTAPGTALTVSVAPSPSAPTAPPPPAAPAALPRPERHLHLLIGLATAIVVVATAILALVPIMMSRKAQELAAAPMSDARRETIAARAIAKSSAVKPCPAPLRCRRSVADHGVDYALCDAVDPTFYEPGTILLVRTPERARLGLLMAPTAAHRLDVTLMTTVPSRRQTFPPDDVLGAVCPR